MSAAVGMIPAAAMKKISVGAAWLNSRMTASGMKGTSRYGHPSALSRNERFLVPPVRIVTLVGRRRR
jgi:hypothetical protein